MTYLVVNMWMCKKTTLLHLDEKNRKNRAVGGSHILKGVKCVKNPDPSIWIKIRSVVPVIHDVDCPVFARLSQISFYCELLR
jgi:hypothetical protein